jgi:hypothetical protein
MLAALIKALNVVSVNCGDIVTEITRVITCVPEVEALKNILELIAG